MPDGYRNHRRAWEMGVTGGSTWVPESSAYSIFGGAVWERGMDPRANIPVE